MTTLLLCLGMMTAAFLSQLTRVMVFVVTQFNVCTVGKGEGSMKTHRWNVNAMVLRCSLYFPPYNLRVVWRADNIEAVTHSLELYLSTPTSHTSKPLQ